MASRHAVLLTRHPKKGVCPERPLVPSAAEGSLCNATPRGSVHPTHLLSHSQITPLRQPFFSSTYELPISQFLCFDIHTKCPGVYPLLGYWSSSRAASLPTEFIPFVFKPLRTLLSFFALSEKSTLLFSSDSALFVQNTRGGVGGTSTVQTKNLHSGAAPSSHCSTTPLVQQWATAREIFTIRGNNCALPGV